MLGRDEDIVVVVGVEGIDVGVVDKDGEKGENFGTSR